MSARLIPVSSKTLPTIAVQRPVVLVGRHPECDVRIDLPKVSRRHCCLALAYDRLVIRDLGSRNGLRVNGRVVDEARLQTGDEVALGPLIFRVEGIDPPPAPAGPPPVAAVVHEPKPESLPDMPLDAEDDLMPLSL